MSVRKSPLILEKAVAVDWWGWKPDCEDLRNEWVVGKAMEAARVDGSF